MVDLGAIGLDDFKLESQLNTRLTAEHVKSLLYTKQRASLPARYHQAIFHEGVPRFWAINWGKDPNGELDKGQWFVRENVECLAWLVNGDLESIKNSDEHEKAIVRRAVIFPAREKLYHSNTQSATDAALLEQWKGEMEHATPW